MSSSAAGSVCPTTVSPAPRTDLFSAEKEKKRVKKAAQESKQEEETSQGVDAEMLREALRAIKNEPPVPFQERENYFMTQVGMGEQLAQQGMPYPSHRCLAHPYD